MSPVRTGLLPRSAQELSVTKPCMAAESEARANKNTEKTELTTRTNAKLFKIASRGVRASELLS